MAASYCNSTSSVLCGTLPARRYMIISYTHLGKSAGTTTGYCPVVPVSTNGIAESSQFGSAAHSSLTLSQILPLLFLTNRA